jgi:thermitase
MYWYEVRFFRVPLLRNPDNTGVANLRAFIEFRITYEHKLCLLGKQHGPLLFTQTLLPGEKVTLYHSDRYQQITSVQNRYSVETTFTSMLGMSDMRVTS